LPKVSELFGGQLPRALRHDYSHSRAILGHTS
jgi:hypothetical protein